MKKSISLLFFFLLGITSGIKAQQTNACQHPAPDTESLKQIKSLLAHPQKSNDLKIIPVVFHVLHQNGSENITDAQIWDAVQILNTDFQKRNADTISVGTTFDTIIGKVNFEFRLATIDPNGNPTNGIDRIFTPLTNAADESTMINEWNPQHYVNIWIVKSFATPGMSGFSTNPLLNTNACQQGIMLLHNVTGSIGTSFAVSARSLTHEMGHYFGLFHTWGNQVPEQSCNFSDGITDTPVSQGNTFCNTTVNSCDDANDAASFAYWGFDPRDNIENFMEFSFCTSMFTKGQAELMRSVAESPLYGRDQLWTTANQLATGTGPSETPPVSEAAPLSNFSILSNSVFSSPYTCAMICAGETVQFRTQNGLVPSATTTYLWSFPGGSPSSSPLEDPVVTYVNPGYYNVTLTASSPHGTTTTTKNAMIYVSGSMAEFTGLTVQDFDQSGDFWLSQNLHEDQGYFQWIPAGGLQNTGCFLLNNQYEPDNTQPCSADALQINGSKDNLVSPAFDLSNTTGVTVSFDYAYGSAAIPNTASEVLKVYSSRDCGKTWTIRKTIQDTALITDFVAQNTEYVPVQTDWKHAVFNYIANSTDIKTRFKFEFTASNYSNNFYLDNFVIDGVLVVTDKELAGLSIFPNPSQKGGMIGISGLGASNADLRICDLQGKLVYEKELSQSEVQLSTDLKSGCYLVEIVQNGSKFITRLIIE